MAEEVLEIGGVDAKVAPAEHILGDLRSTREARHHAAKEHHHLALLTYISFIMYYRIIYVLYNYIYTYIYTYVSLLCIVESYTSYIHIYVCVYDVRPSRHAPKSSRTTAWALRGTRVPPSRTR